MTAADIPIPGGFITSSCARPQGGGASSPAILLASPILTMNGESIELFKQLDTYTFDTYTFRKSCNHLDWYRIDFSGNVSCNCIEMTMGIPYWDGGWWTSLEVIYARDDGPWEPVMNLRCYPELNFNDERGSRRPFETHFLHFEKTTLNSIMVRGKAGGINSFTSLSRLVAVNHSGANQFRDSAQVPPLARIYQLITPETIRDLSRTLARATRVGFGFPLLEYYIRDLSLEQSIERPLKELSDSPELWFLVGDKLGWSAWKKLSNFTRVKLDRTIHINSWLDGVFAKVSIPLIVEEEYLGDMYSSIVLLKETGGSSVHKELARRLGIPWKDYSAAKARMPQLSHDQLEGIAQLIELITQSLVQLAHRNRLLSVSRWGERRNADYRKEMVRQATQFMQSRLEQAIHVSDVALRVNLSLSHFSTVFRAETGIPASEFLNRLKIERAKELLTDGLSVIDVATVLGFTSSYFSNLFKKLVGKSPAFWAR